MAVLEVAGLAKAFGGVQAVHDVSFALDAGELLALIGPNGAGKTTCFNCLNGQLRPDAGSVRLAGRELVGLPPRRIWRHGRRPDLPDHPDLRLDDRDRERAAGADRAAPAHPQPVARRRHASTATRREALLGRVEMADQAERACGVLAYGDLKRVELAIALAQEPVLLLLDEPTAGMAPRERVALMALTRSIVRAQRPRRAVHRARHGRGVRPSPTGSW